MRTLQDTIDAAKVAKEAGVAAASGRYNIEPMVELVRGGELMAVLQCHRRESDAHDVPTNTMYLAAAMFDADDVRLSMDVYHAEQPVDAPLPTPGDLRESFTRDPFSDVQEALLLGQRRRGERFTTCVAVPFTYREQPGEPLAVAWGEQKDPAPLEHGPAAHALAHVFDRTDTSDAFMVIRQALLDEQSGALQAGARALAHLTGCSVMLAPR